MKIDKLSPQQEKDLELWYQRGLATSLATERTKPTNEARCREVIAAFYAEAKLTVPEIIEFHDSPAACVKAIKLLDPDCTDFTAIYGQNEIYWVAYYDFARHIGIEYSAKANAVLDLWKRQCDEMFCWYAYDNAVFVSKRPTVLLVDDQQRLHCGTGPALAFADGTAVYSWRNQRVPAEWIEERTTIDAALCFKIDDLDKRQTFADIIGWDRILGELNCKTIDEDVDPMVGTLLEVNLPDAGVQRFLRAKCGTGRTVVVLVSRDFNTALEANAQTYTGITASLLRHPERVRT